MIDEIGLADFKSYHDADLPLASLTLLIGANASGKTNAIEAIRFLAQLAHGQRLDDILDDIRQNDLTIRGKVADMVYDRDPIRAEAPWFVLGVKLAGSTTWRVLRIILEMRPAPVRCQVIEESVCNDWEHDGDFLYQARIKGGSDRYEIPVAYEDFTGSSRKPTTPCSNRQAIFTQLDLPSRFQGAEAQRVIPAVVTEFQEALRQIIFLDLNPRAMVGYSFIADNVLRPDGGNLSSVLFDICRKQGREKEVLKFISGLPEQKISGLDFLEGPRGEAMVQVVETFGGVETKRDAPLLSDGTLRVLAIAAALLSAPTGGLVVIEEIDNGVHPSRAKELLANILAASKKNSLRVLLTSHNPALLDTLPKEAVPDVVCCYRDPQEGDSRLVRLSDLTDYPDLVARGPLGQLMTQGLLDKYLKNQRTPEQKAEQAQEWLRQLQLEDEEG